MGYQMLLVLLAVILFSTIFLGSFNGIFMHSEQVFRGAYRLQAQKIVDYYFQRVDASLLLAMADGNASTNFSSVFSGYSNTNINTSVDGINYQVQFNTYQCDQFGNTSNPSANYRLLTATVEFVINATDTLYVGTSSAPLSKVYADNGMYD